MAQDLHGLTGETFDLLVVGGGIHGVCVARDATLRGLRVALIERDDFGAATSHNSLKLVHGGFRYLQHLDIARLRQSVEERRYWLWAAPHLVRPLRFVMPLYGHLSRGPLALRAGIAAYGALSFDRNRGLPAESRIPSGGVVSRAECARLIPGVDTDGLTGGATWHDGQIQDADRLLLECLLDAVRHGAVVANHLVARELLHADDRIDGVRAASAIDGTEIEIRARLTVNTCGPWIDQLLGGTAGLRRDGATGLSKCMNLVTRPITDGHAFGVRSSRASDALLGRERRMFFFTPWKNRTVIGTSHLPYRGSPDDCRFTEEDIAGFLDEINAACPAARLDLSDVAYCYGGLTPAEDGAHVRGEVARARKGAVIDHRKANGIDGLFSAVGVKWTTARRVAEKVVDMAADRLGRDGLPAGARVTPLPSPGPSGDATLADRCRRAVREEYALRLADVVFRRCDLSHRGEFGSAMLDQCADIMAAELGWTAARREAELAAVRADRWWRMPDTPAAAPDPALPAAHAV